MRLALAAAALGTLLAAAAGQTTGPPTPPIFNGVDLKGWKAVTKDPKADGSKTWGVKDKILTCTGKPTGYLVTESTHANYRLALEYRYPPTEAKRPNSGVLVHVQPGTHFWPHCLEVQFAHGEAGDLWLQYDADKKLPTLKADPKRKDPANAEGRRYRRSDDGKPVEKPIGEWNSCEVVCAGGTIKVSVNGKLVNEASECSLTRGAIGLQAEGVPVEFRGIEVADVGVGTLGIDGLKSVPTITRPVPAKP